MRKTKIENVDKSECFDCPKCGSVFVIQLFAQVAGVVLAGEDPKKVFPQNMSEVCFVVACRDCLTPIPRGNPKIEKYVKEFIEWAEHGLGNHSDPDYLNLRADHFRRRRAEEHL